MHSSTSWRAALALAACAFAVIPSQALDAANADQPDGRMRFMMRESNGDRVTFGHDVTVLADENVHDVVTIGGSSTIDGTVANDVVSIGGDNKVNGEVGGGAVSVLGSTYVNAPVGNDVVAVLGDVVLGPKAFIDGEVISIGGTVTRDPAAIVTKGINNITLWGASLPKLSAWFRQCLLFGRPLAFSQDVRWAWVVAGTALLVYTIIALLFNGAVTRCAQTLETRPGGTILAALLSLLLCPLLVALLGVTVVGLLLAPILFIALVIGGVFGRTALLAWLGRRILRPIGMEIPPAALAVIIGGVLVVLVYTVPVLGGMLWQVVGLLGFGMVVYTLLLSMKRETPASAGPAASWTAPAVASAVAVAPAASEFRSSEEIVPPAVPMESAAAGGAAAPAVYPYAGFWIRIVGVILDVLLVGIVIGAPTKGILFLPGMAIYTACLWKYKGATLGGIIFGIQIMRTDGRPMDWTTAVVRALGCFLSAAVVGLGFLWIAFDPEKRAWHDKIAGTVAVRPPKGISLV